MMDLIYTTISHTNKKVPCDAEMHKPAFSVDYRYSNCSKCGGTANNPNEMPESIKVDVLIHKDGSVTIPVGCKLSARDMVKIYKFAEVHRCN